MEETKYCFLQFKFLRHTYPGEEVFITGNTPSLGNWSIDKSEKMVTNSTEYPLWKSKENIKVPQNYEIQYKYLIFKNGKFFQWEKTENNMNRKVKVGNYFRLVVLDPGSKVEKFTQAIPSSPPSISMEGNNSEDDNDDFNFECKFEFDNKRSIELSNNSEEIKKDNLNNPSDNYLNLLPELNYEIKEEDNTYNLNDQKLEEEYNSDENNINENENDEILIISFYLPINACQKENGEWHLESANEPLYHTLNMVTRSNKKIKWVGVLKNYDKISDEKLKKQLCDDLLFKHNMHVVKIPPEMFDQLFIFFTEFIEPLFHYVTVHDSGIESNEEKWQIFRTFNEIITKKILEIINENENTLIFINDYHFFFVPSLVYSMISNFKQKIISKISIGFFMHCPFPSVDVFKKLPYREEILKSLMNCSVIGFHTYFSSSNFIRTAKVVLSVDCASTLQGDIAISYLGRKLIIRVANITPEPSVIKQELDSDEFKLKYSEIKGKNKTKFVFVSVDNIQFLSTIGLKLEGYKRFLQYLGKENAGKVVFIEYIRMGSDDIGRDKRIILSKEQSELLQKIKEIAENINKEYNDECLVLNVNSITYRERLALFASANCFIRTSKRESFSLGIYEYILLKIYLNETKNVEYMISQLSGVTSTLAHSIKINPYDANSITNGFLTAFQSFFDGKESENKEKDFILVKKSSSKKWLFFFCRDIRKYKNKEGQSFYMGAGLGLNFRLMKTQVNFKEMNKPKVINDYTQSNRRLIFYNFNPDNSPLYSSQTVIFQIINLLNTLSKDPRNTVFFLSSLSQRDLDDYLDDFPVKFIVVSESGYSFKLTGEGSWERVNPSLTDWTGIVVNILEPYTEKCEGSYIEERQSSVLWHYRNSDVEHGKLYANTICNELDLALSNDNIVVRQLDQCVEISNKNVNKGSFVSLFLKRFIKDGKTPEFIIAIGNEYNDELLFCYLRNKKEEIEKYMRYQALYSVVIGKKPSNAMSYINSIVDVKNLFDDFAKCSGKINMSKSTFNINSLFSKGSFTTKDFSVKSGE